MSRNSSFDSVNSKASSPLPSGLPSRPPCPSPPVGRGISSPLTYSLLPGTTWSVRPVRRLWWNNGSEMPRVGIATFSPCSISATLRLRNASCTADLTSTRARAKKRWRLLRLLPFGLGRRSTMFIAPTPPCQRLTGLVDPHVPLDEPPDLTLGIAALDQPLDEIGVLLFGLRILLTAEADDRQQILDLREHPPLDDLTQLLIGGPGRVAPAG